MQAEHAKPVQKLLDGYRRRDPRISRLLQNMEIAYPEITCPERLSFHLGDNLNAEIIHPEMRAHTDGDSMLFVKDDSVLFAGNVVWVGYHPNLEDADTQGQVRALRTILRMKPRRIVPGHGPVCGLREVERLIRYLEEFDENSAAVLKEGLTDERLVRRVIPRWSWSWTMRWLAEPEIRHVAEVAIEPDPRNYDLLTENVARNRLSNIITLNIAVGDKNTAGEFMLAQNSLFSQFASTKSKKIT